MRRRDGGHGLALLWGPAQAAPPSSGKNISAALRMKNDSVVAEVDKVAPGERTARLLHATADHEAAKMNGREAEAGDQILYEFDRLRVIPGYEDDAAATVFCRPLVEPFNDDRIERLYDSGAGRQCGDHLARAPVAKVCQHEFGTVRAERVRRIDEDPSIPRRQASKCVLDIRPGDGKQDIVKARCFRDRDGRCTVAEFGDYVGKGVRAVPVAQCHLMTSPQGFSREPKRDRARADRSEPHDAAPCALEK